MSEHTDSDTGFLTTLSEEIGVAKRPANALVEEYPTRESVLETFLADDRFDHVSGVGNRTTGKLWDWLTETYPEKNRERIENSEAYCTEFTTDHGLEESEKHDPEMFYWAWICPRDGHKNVMKGDPRDFADRPFACVQCRWVPLLDRESLLEWFESENLEAEIDANEVPA
ncbi:hypothetical protein [Natronosalvus amylolyticus]|uniref:hypothetical protein n=1 Tax=Natronosalvus amylolyticus TaxID=2961994 RepID=UPI0020C9AB46|nr:hypothetical protein [Natronosalvus amylolyticus]